MTDLRTRENRIATAIALAPRFAGRWLRFAGRWLLAILGALLGVFVALALFAGMVVAVVYIVAYFVL